MKILFIHPNFPGQFLHLAAAMGQHPNHEVVFLSATGEGELSGVKRVFYQVKKKAQSPHAYVNPVETAMFTGEAVWDVACSLRRQGFVPDIIYGHVSWGTMMFLKEAFPEAMHVVYCEWFAQPDGQYFDYGGEMLSLNERCRMKTSQVATLIPLIEADAGIAPFLWQKKQFPVEFQKKIEVIPDGVDVERFAPMAGGASLLKEFGFKFSEAKELLTYVSRGMEPMRGFPQFAESLAIVQKRRSDCQTVIVGNLQPAYEQTAFDAQKCLLEAGVDLRRIHFTGLLPRPIYRRILQASTVHIYLTKPFVLSWSFLDALACGCATVASATPPVQEVIEDGKTGLLTPFGDSGKLAERIEFCLQGGLAVEKMRKSARDMMVQRFSLKYALNRQREFLQNMLV